MTVLLTFAIVLAANNFVRGGLAYGQADEPTPGPEASVGTVHNSLAFPGIEPGDVKVVVTQTVTPARVAPGERVRVAREAQWTLPGAGTSVLCITPLFDPSASHFSFGVSLAGGEHHASHFHLYPVSGGPEQHRNGPGLEVPGRIISEAETPYDRDPRTCHTHYVLTLTGEFTAQDPGVYYVSLGSSVIGGAPFNGVDVLTDANYVTEGSLPILQVGPKAGSQLYDATRQQCAVENADSSTAPWNEPTVWRQLQHDICVAAIRFGISPTLLAILLQNEGSKRARWVQSGLDRWIEEHMTVFGQNQRIGPARMCPDLAVELSRLFGDQLLTEGEARNKLAQDSAFAVSMAAAELSRLQAQHGLDDRQTFIAYPGGTDLVPELKKTNFSGPDATSRGAIYDKIRSDIIGNDGFAEPAKGASW